MRPTSCGESAQLSAQLLAGLLAIESRFSRLEELQDSSISLRRGSVCWSSILLFFTVGLTGAATSELVKAEQPIKKLIFIDFISCTECIQTMTVTIKHYFQHHFYFNCVIQTKH